MYKSELIALLAKSITDNGDGEVIFTGARVCGLYANFSTKSIDESGSDTAIYGEEE